MCSGKGVCVVCAWFRQVFTTYDWARPILHTKRWPSKKMKKIPFIVLNLTEKEKLVFVPLRLLCAIQFCGMALLKEEML